MDSLFWGPLIIPGLLWKENPDTRGSFWECQRESRKKISSSDIGFVGIGLFIPWTLVGWAIDFSLYPLFPMLERQGLACCFDPEVSLEQCAPSSIPSLS